MVTLADFERMVADATETLPASLRVHLTGGVIVDGRTVRDRPDLRDVYTLAHYVPDPGGLGRRVVVYYGSFVRALGDVPPWTWRREIETTLRHELHHHMDDLAGIIGEPEREDDERMAAWEAARGGGTTLGREWVRTLGWVLAGFALALALIGLGHLLGRSL
jgi:hypothetical protein